MLAPKACCRIPVRQLLCAAGEPWLAICCTVSRFGAGCFISEASISPVFWAPREVVFVTCQRRSGC